MATDPDDDAAEQLARLAGSVDRWQPPAEGEGGAGDGSSSQLRQVRTVGASLVRSARAAGAGAVTSGRWLADLLVDVAGRLPVRDQEMLLAQHPGYTGEALAHELVRRASRATAAIGAAAGAVAAAEELNPASWAALPAGLLVEIAVVSAVELKLVAELHAVLDRPVEGRGVEKGVLLANAWAEQKGVSVTQVVAGDGIAGLVGTATRREAVRVVRRRLAGRAGRSLSSLLPMLVGAAAAAEVNRRATRKLGESVVRDLLRRKHRS